MGHYFSQGMGALDQAKTGALSELGPYSMPSLSTDYGGFSYNPETGFNASLNPALAGMAGGMMQGAAAAPGAYSPDSYLNAANPYFSGANNALNNAASYYSPNMGMLNQASNLMMGGGQPGQLSGQAFNQLGSFNPQTAAEGMMAQQVGAMQPYWNRDTSALQDTLLAQGRLGSTGGARQQAALAGQQDTTKLGMYKGAWDSAQQTQQNLANMGMGLGNYGQGMGSNMLGYQQGMTGFGNNWQNLGSGLFGMGQGMAGIGTNVGGYGLNRAATMGQLGTSLYGLPTGMMNALLPYQQQIQDLAANRANVYTGYGANAANMVAGMAGGQGGMLGGLLSGAGSIIGGLL